MFRLVGLACVLLVNACTQIGDYSPVSYTRDVQFAGWDYKVYTNGTHARVELVEQGLLSASPAARSLSVFAIEASTNCAVTKSELTDGGRALSADIDCTRPVKINI